MAEAPREAAQKLADHVRLLRNDSEHAHNEWERTPTVANALRRDDARKRLEDLEYAEPVALWVLSLGGST